MVGGGYPDETLRDTFPGRRHHAFAWLAGHINVRFCEPPLNKAEGRAEGRLPISPPPHQVFVRLTEDGWLAIKTVSLIHKQMARLAPDGHQALGYRRLKKIHWDRWTLVDFGRRQTTT
jgi:hypothetical protein